MISWMLLVLSLLLLTLTLTSLDSFILLFLVLCAKYSASAAYDWWRGFSTKSSHMLAIGCSHISAVTNENRNENVT